MNPPELTVVTPRVPAIERLVDDYLAACRRKGLSPKTIKFSYGFPLRGVFLPWCAREDITAPTQLTQPMLDRFTDELTERGGKNGALSKQSILTYTRTVNHFLVWAHKKKELDQVKAQQPTRLAKKHPDVLSRKEMEALEKAARNERDKLLVRVLIDTGMRLGELVGLRCQDLEEQKGPDRHMRYFLRVTGKGERDRKVPITPDLHRRLEKYIEDYRPQDVPTDRLFLSLKRRPHGDYAPLTGSGVNQLITTLAEQAGIRKRVYPHLLRHSYATLALSRGMNAVQLADILGHASMTMIKDVYSHLAPHDAYDAQMKILNVREEE